MRSGLSEAAGIRVIVDGRKAASAGSLDLQVLNQLLDEAETTSQNQTRTKALHPDVVPPNLDLSDPTILQITEDQRSTVAVDLNKVSGLRPRVKV